MTKKDYELIANVLKQHQPYTRLNTNLLQWMKLVESFASKLEQQNPKFNKIKFIKACGSVQEP